MIEFNLCVKIEQSLFGNDILIKSNKHSYTTIKAIKRKSSKDVADQDQY